MKLLIFLEFARLERKTNESCLAYLKRLNEFIYKQKQRLLQKNKKAQNKVIELLRNLSSEQKKSRSSEDCSKFFIEVGQFGSYWLTFLRLKIKSCISAFLSRDQQSWNLGWTSQGFPVFHSWYIPNQRPGGINQGWIWSNTFAYVSIEQQLCGDQRVVISLV